jgi:glycosyltransferase involved in cell wall biosynthesis
MGKLRVAIIAPPWIALPVKGYGGIEMVLEGLVRSLQRQGVEVELFANGQRTMRGVTTHSYYKTEQFHNIYKPYYESFPANPSHDIGVIYNTDDLEQTQDFNGLYATCISEAMTATVPSHIKPRMLSAVHNGVNPGDFPFVKEKKPYFITLARFAPYKGQHIAVQAAAKLGKKLRMAGPVADILSNRKLLLELANPQSAYRNDPQFKYYSDEILPYAVSYRNITYSGNLSGKKKLKFLSEAKALLFPITWDEPFGMSVIEALACGTPVVAMNRGAMPEIIEHGVTGFLANNEDEFIEYMQRVDEIDPEACRRSVEEKFSADAMASAYLDRYYEVLKLVKRR